MRLFAFSPASRFISRRSFGVVFQSEAGSPRFTHVPCFIERKRNGHELTQEDIAAFIAGFTGGSIPDYQASA